MGRQRGARGTIQLEALDPGEPRRNGEEATHQASERASRTLRNIRSVWVKEFEAVVDGNSVSQFRVNLKVSFLLDEVQGMQSAEDLAHAGGP
jgi:flavin-binding protein dodecin